MVTEESRISAARSAICESRRYGPRGNRTEPDYSIPGGDKDARKGGKLERGLPLPGRTGFAQSPATRAVARTRCPRSFLYQRRPAGR